jgi:hypothetical protein
VDRSSPDKTPVLRSRITETKLDTPSLVPGHRYAWRVRGQRNDGSLTFYSADKNFTAAMAVVYSPAVDARTDSLPTVSWASVPTATGYDVAVDNETTNQRNVRTLSNIAGTSATPSRLAVGFRYSVKVRPRFANGGLGAWSSPVAFRVNRR